MKRSSEHDTNEVGEKEGKNQQLLGFIHLSMYNVNIHVVYTTGVNDVLQSVQFKVTVHYFFDQIIEG